MPQVFIQQNPYLNAYTFGTGSQNILVITHSLYEQLDEEQLSFIIGHEMGHIKSQHVLFKSMARWHQNKKHLFSEQLSLAVLNWERISEVTADRAGVISCQNIEAACRALLTLAMGSIKIAKQVDIEDYLDSQLLSLDFNPLGQQAQKYNSHYYIPIRMRQLKEFYKSTSYENIFWYSLDLITKEADLQVEIELK